MPLWSQAGLWGLLAGSALVVGARIGYYVNVPRRIVAIIMAFGSGVLISALSFELMEEAFDHGGMVATAIGFLSGGLIFTIANVILAAQGAKTVAMDVIFGELRDDHPSVSMANGEFVESDEFFAHQLRHASNVIIATTPDLQPPDLFTTNGLALGDISTDKDSDGILRRAILFRTYRQWHPLFKQVEADPGYGVDLSRARVEPAVDRRVQNRGGERRREREQNNRQAREYRRLRQQRQRHGKKLRRQDRDHDRSERGV